MAQYNSCGMNSKFYFFFFILCSLVLSLTQYNVAQSYKPIIQSLPAPTDQQQSQNTSSSEQPAPVSASEPLPSAPIASVTENTALGPLPIIAEDGTTPFQAYAYPPVSKDSFAKRAFIIHSLGLQESLTQQIIDQLPPEITLAFSPYAPNLNDWVQKARNKGHEVLLQLPIQSEDAVFDPGPYGLKADLPPDENLEKLTWTLSRMTGYLGVITIAPTELGDGTTGPFASVLQDLNKRGLLLVTPTSDSTATLTALLRYYAAITKNEIPDMTSTDLVYLLDNLASPTTDISTPQIVAMAPSPAVIQALIQWFAQQPQPSAHYFSPLSYLVKDNAKP